jgi:hypothetical protein
MPQNSNRNLEGAVDPFPMIRCSFEMQSDTFSLNAQLRRIKGQAEE